MVLKDKQKYTVHILLLHSTKRLTNKISHRAHTKEEHIYWASATGKAQLAKRMVC